MYYGGRPYFVRSGDSYTDLLGSWYSAVLALLIVHLGTCIFLWFVANGVAYPVTERFDTLDYWVLFGNSITELAPILVLALLWHPASNEMYWFALIATILAFLANAISAFYFISYLNQCSSTVWCSAFPVLTTDSSNVDWPFIATWVGIAVMALLNFLYVIFINVMWRIETFRVFLRHISASSGDPYTRFGYGPNAGMFFAGQSGGGKGDYADPRAYQVASAADAIEMMDAPPAVPAAAAPLEVISVATGRPTDSMATPLMVAQQQSASSSPAGREVIVTSPLAHQFARAEFSYVKSRNNS